MDLYKAFLKYATSGAKYNSDIDTLERFFFIVYWGVGAANMPKHSSKDMKRTLREIYLREVQNDKLLGKTKFLDMITAFMELEGIDLREVTE
jgi:hypothetical protein